MSPRLSVLMPLYNCERFLSEAIVSILEQTFTDFELLIVDDGSSDSSAEIVRSFCARDERIRVFFLGKNFGISTAMNRGLREARAPLIARADSDDICVPNRFAKQVSYMNKHPNIYMLGCRAINVDEFGNKIKRKDCKAGIIEGVGNYGIPFPTDRQRIADRINKGEYPLLHATLIYRTSAVIALGGYREVFSVGEDLDLYKRMLFRYGCVFANLSSPLYFYRRYRGSVCSISGQYAAKRQLWVNILIHYSADYLRRGLPDPLATVKHLPPPPPFKSTSDELITMELIFYLHSYRKFYNFIPKVQNFRDRAKDLRRLRMIMSKLSLLPRGSKIREFLYSRLILLIFPDMPSSKDELEDFLKSFDQALFEMNDPVYDWDYCNNCISVARACLGFGEWKSFLRYMLIAFRFDFIYTLRFIFVRSFVHLIVRSFVHLIKYLK